MEKRIKNRKFGRTESQRKAMLNSLAGSVFLKGRIKTTQAKAKELRRFAEKLITEAKKGDLSARRRLLRFLPEKIVKKIFDEIAPKYAERPGGYFRIINLNPRPSDGSKISIIELVE